MFGWKGKTAIAGRKAMKAYGRLALAAMAALPALSCTPDWATANNTPFILEIASITPSPLRSDVERLNNAGQPTVFNDDVSVSVNVFRKNNQPTLGTTPVEHVYLERYEVRFFRSDGHNTEGVDVPFHITGPLGNLRFHTASPGGQGEVEQAVAITLVRHQAKLEPPLKNLAFGGNEDIITTIAEITIHARTVQGGVLEARGSVQVSFADFADQ
jgi:hypothetical protein